MTMEEIEQSSGETTLNSDDTGAPSEPTSENVAATKETSEAGAEGTNNDNKDDEGPFHKHPRWIERENELKAEREARKALEDRTAQMAEQLRVLTTPKPAAKPQSQFVADLAKVNPEYGKWAEAQEAKMAELEELKAWRQQSEATRTQERALSVVKGLHEQNKVPEDQRRWIENELIVAENRGQLKRVEDIATYYKSAQESLAKMIDAIRRGDREGYVAAKTGAAATPPSQPKGAPVKAGKAPEWSKDPAEARQQLIERIVKASRAATNI